MLPFWGSKLVALAEAPMTITIFSNNNESPGPLVCVIKLELPVNPGRKLSQVVLQNVVEQGI